MSRFFQFTCHRCQISLQHYLKHLYLLSAPCVSHVSMVTVLKYKVWPYMTFVRLNNKNNMPNTNDLSKTVPFLLEVFLNFQSLCWFHSNQLREIIHLSFFVYCSAAALVYNSPPLFFLKQNLNALFFPLSHIFTLSRDHSWSISCAFYFVWCKKNIIWINFVSN